MAIQSLFMGSVNRDRVYKADQFAKYFALFIANGYYPNEGGGLAVTANGGMNINIASGAVFENGYQGVNEDNYILIIEPADANLNRIDRIIFRHNYLTRQFEFFVRKGTPATTPTAQNIVRNADYYEFALADIYIEKATSAITPANITDTRLNNNLCGIVHGLIDQISTTTLFLQLQAELNRFKEENEADFLAWVEYLETVLDDNTAAHLLSLIEATKDELNNTKRNLNDLIFHTEQDGAQDYLIVENSDGTKAHLEPTALFLENKKASLNSSGNNVFLDLEGAFYVRNAIDPTTYKNIVANAYYIYTNTGAHSVLSVNSLAIGSLTNTPGYNIVIRGNTADTNQTTVQIIRSGRNMMLTAEDMIVARKQSSNGTGIPVQASAFPIYSSKRFKVGIKNITAKEWTDKFSKLQPRKYFHKDDTEKKTVKYGFIAEEVEQTVPELVMYNNIGQAEALFYTDFIAVHHMKIQEYETRIETLENEIAEIKRQLK